MTIAKQIKIKIERKAIPALRTRATPFVAALAALKVGQSFVHAVTSNHRYAMSITQQLLGREFTTRRDGEQFRIYRIR